MITPALAARFARIALGHVAQRYPYKLDHVLTGDQDAVPPHMLHPIFHGSFDWHSCVHGYWLLARTLHHAPEMAAAPEIVALFDAMLVPEKVAGELAYLARPSSTGFERPYGWAWLLALHRALALHDRPWADALAPLARAFAARFHSYLPKLDYPIRAGTHANTAFALLLAKPWADVHDPALAALFADYAREKFGADRDAQAWEPSGDAFLSPTLVAAAAMQALLPAERFAAWFAAYLPRLAQGEPAALFTPARVSDRSDGKIAHLDGVNLSRAWCWRRLLPALTGTAAERVGEAIDAHLAASLDHIADDYAGTHWLATFALLALEPL